MNCKPLALKILGKAVHSALACLALLLLGLPISVAAQPKCEVATPAAQMMMMETPYMGMSRDKPVGSPLSRWSLWSSAFTFKCTGSGRFGVAMKLQGLSPAGVTAQGNSGGPVTVFNTNLPGVGVVFEGSLEAPGCMARSFDLGGGAGASGQPNLQWGGGYGQWLECPSSVPGTASAPIIMKVQASMRYIKTKPLMSAGQVVLGQPVIEIRHSINGVLTRSNWGIHSVPMEVRAHSTCKVEDLTVAMGRHKSSAFTGIGTSSVPPAKFTIVVACPPGMSTGTSYFMYVPSIAYQFSAPAGVAVPAQGVIALSSDSTATGIGLQLKDGAGTPLQFSKNYVLLGYNVDTGSNLAIPLQATYYQTGAVVGPGTANAVMTFTLNYP